MKKIEVLGLQTIPEVQQGNNLAEMIVNSADSEIGGLQDKDIIVITSKIISKAMGLTKKLSEVKPEKKALAISRKTGKDPKWLQMIFDKGHKILAIMPLKGIFKQHIMNSSEDLEICMELVEHEQAVCITLGKEGRIHTCDAGIDGSNHPAGVVSFLPEDPDQTAKEIREQIQQLCGRQVAVILADTEMIPLGTIDLAVGSSGIEPRAKMFAKKDLFGKPKFGGIDLIAYELTAASALVFGQINAGIPAVVVRGYEYEISETANIANRIWLRSAAGDIRKTIKATMQATSHAWGLKGYLLRIASWFV
jgi:coenzyme F420-0:L-glutamate ligase/coenzyme F420-1:gamma-L-glutamate ligase